MLQVPSVGRIVHFYTKDPARQFNGAREGPYAAMIIQPHGERCASLRVFPPFADEYTAGSVMLDDDTRPDDAVAYQRWKWPPRAGAS